MKNISNKVDVSCRIIISGQKAEVIFAYLTFLYPAELFYALNCDKHVNIDFSISTLGFNFRKQWGAQNNDFNLESSFLVKR